MEVNFKLPNLPKKSLLIAAAGLVLAVLTLFIIFCIRSPVLILTEESFIVLYGKQRLIDEAFDNSIAMFRRVKMVVVANDAGEDIVPHAVNEVSSSPYCVLFPLRFTRSARLYKEQYPNIPVIILEGRSLRSNTDFDFVYKTDIENDFYKAGLAVLQITDGKIAVFLESSIERQAREAFLRGFGEEKASEADFYTNFSHYSQNSELSCAVLAGIGHEFFEGNANIHVPVIYISWLDPGYMPSNVLMYINDSPLAQVRGAVRLFSAGEKEGLIKSKIALANGKNIDRKILRKIQKIR